MMIRIRTLTIKNFKGIQQMALSFEGQNADITGANGSGKTTIKDAVQWLLFDKDSQNRKDFAIKPHDKDGNELHNLEHSVSASFDIDGADFSIAKIYREKYTKKRGALTSEFTGHTTDYVINGVPVKKTEYTNRIAEVFDEKLFALLASTTHFNEVLKWQERREMLAKLAGDIEESAIVAKDKNFVKVPDILDGKNIDDKKKIIIARRKAINETLSSIPVRIDEAKRSIEGLGESDTRHIESVINDIEEQIFELRRIQSQQASGNNDAAKAAAMQAELNYKEAESVVLNELRERYSQAAARYTEAKGNVTILTQRIEGAKGQDYDAIIAANNEEMAKLRSEWANTEKTFVFEAPNACVTCGQALNDESVEKARKAAEKQFSQALKGIKESIQKRGLELKAHNEKLASEKEAVHKEQEKTRVALDNEKALMQKLQIEVDTLKRQAEEVKQTPELSALRDAWERAKAAANAEPHCEAASYDETITQLTNDRNSLLKQLHSTADTSAITARIAELEETQITLTQEYNKLEAELFLLEKYIRARCELIEEAVNEKFELVKFKLFDMQINGGMLETCETLINGVPYHDANTASRINAGIDIINVFSKVFGLHAPLIIDNAESVTQLLKSDSQTITLTVGDTPTIQIVKGNN